jgi:uncharacterized membrane protein YphA (DoxX/SURF4 family)
MGSSMMEFLSPQTSPAPSPLPGLVRSVAIAILRVGSASLLTGQHLWPQVVAGYHRVWEQAPWALVGELSARGIPFAEIVAPPAAALAFASGVSLALGMLTRAAALLLIALVAAAFPAAWAAGQAEAAILYVIAFAALVLLGGGHFSLDALFALRRKAED